MRVEFWFDFSCPYAYLASTQIEAVCRRAGATLELCPMLLGGVFRAIGAGDGPMSTQSLTRTRYTATDVARWAAQGEVALAWPARHPQRTVLALRAMLGLPPAWWATAMHALFAAYWRDRRDPTEPAELRAALTAAGVPATLVDAALAGAEAPAIKDALRARTDAAVARGVFGAPAMVVDDGRRQTLLWGQDRMHLVEAALAGWWPDDDTPGPPPAVTRPPGAARAAVRSISSTSTSTWPARLRTSGRPRSRRSAPPSARRCGGSPSCSARCSARSVHPTCRCSGSPSPSAATSAATSATGPAGGRCRWSSRVGSRSVRSPRSA
jgi:2-hydroxychromene-2-carboxylate isomerase